MTAAQRTLKDSSQITGVGLHSGRNVSMSLLPAAADTGINFVRTDIEAEDNLVPARWDHVVDTKLCTVVGNKDGISVGTVEHLMAALRGCGVDNAVIELDGPEVPVMDGSAAPFVDLIESVGTVEQDSARRMIRVLKPVTVEANDKKVSLLPGNKPVFTGQIDFEHPAIGTQERKITLVNGNFCHDLANSRTFGFVEQVEILRKNGLALGGSLDNAIVLDRERVMNPEGLRHSDEFIRHKLLDAIGDLYLAGHAILGTYEGYKGGHDMNNRLLRALFAQDDAWSMA